jgi:hypothetical protein
LNKNLRDSHILTENNFLNAVYLGLVRLRLLCREAGYRKKLSFTLYISPDRIAKVYDYIQTRSMKYVLSESDCRSVNRRFFFFLIYINSPGTFTGIGGGGLTAFGGAHQAKKVASDWRNFTTCTLRQVFRSFRSVSNLPFPSPCERPCGGKSSLYFSSNLDDHLIIINA